MAKAQAEDKVTHMELLEADHGFGLGSSMLRLDLVFLFLFFFWSWKYVFILTLMSHMWWRVPLIPRQPAGI